MDNVYYLSHIAGISVRRVEDITEALWGTWADEVRNVSILRTNNPMERIMREIHRRTWVVGNFPEGNSALKLMTSRLRYIADRQWGNSKKETEGKSLRRMEMEMEMGIGISLILRFAVEIGVRLYE